MDGIQQQQQQKIIKIQSWFRGCMYRMKRLPLILYTFQTYLKTKAIQFSTQNDDGRINSCMDEAVVIKILIEKFGDRIKAAKPRHWYDLLALDYMYGWIPINIKTNKMTGSGNVGNMSIAVHAYTDEMLDIFREQTYDNGKMSVILLKKIKR